MTIFLGPVYTIHIYSWLRSGSEKHHWPLADPLQPPLSSGLGRHVIVSTVCNMAHTNNSTSADLTTAEKRTAQYSLAQNIREQQHQRGKTNAGFVQLHGVLCSCLSPPPSVSPPANCDRFAPDTAGSLSASRTIQVPEMSMKTSQLHFCNTMVWLSV